MMLLDYVASAYRVEQLQSAAAISTGALATSEDGQKWLDVNGVGVRRCKSDLVLTITPHNGPPITVGVSIKHCNNAKPTNAQFFFTKARAFGALLNSNGIAVSDTAITALRQFCGDSGFRPLDDPAILQGRASDPRRYFWEEIDPVGRNEWETLFQAQQDAITRLMFQKAYADDPFVPNFLAHKTCRADDWANTEVAIYSIDELVAHSRAYRSFSTREYSVHGRSYPDPPGVKHQAPRFGIVQMQRGGQRQHPDQLQFNLEAGYFYKIENVRPDVIGNRGGQERGDRVADACPARAG